MLDSGNIQESSFVSYETDENDLVVFFKEIDGKSSGNIPNYFRI
jgi:hypothetical protein